jgi:thiosulfate/3-mercaptopyruvate sulfurtransferase
MTTNQGYARPELLAEPDWLWEHRDDPNVRLIDCATLEAYRRAHIPGALGLPVHFYIKDPANETFVMPPEAFAELMGKLGVGDDTTVVTYDDNNSLVAARLWWVLNYYGHANAKVLNGGWHRWLTEQRPVTFHQSRAQPATFTPRPNNSLICDAGGLKAKIDTAGIQIMDMRTDEEWLGTNNRGNKRAGHVPGAIHLEWLNYITSDDRRVFKPADELRAMLQTAGISPENEVVTYCQGGIRAAHGAFVLSLLGWDRVRNYDGSMRDWANREDTPLVLEPAS